MFDSDEASGTVTCAASAATLVFTIPGDVPDGVASGGDTTFLRLQAAITSAQLGPTKVVAAGEVEDWPVTLRVPRLTVTKTTPSTQIPASGSTVVYTLTVKNAGNGDFTTTYPAYVYDNYAGATAVAAYTTSTTPGSWTATAPQTGMRRWTGALTAGSTVTITVTMTVNASLPALPVMTNVVRVSSSAYTDLTAAGTCTVGSADELAQACAVHALYRAGLTLTKQAYYASGSQAGTLIPTGTALPPGTQVTWNYTITNTGSGPLTNVVLTDDATDTKTSASGTTVTTGKPTITCSGAPAVTPGTTVTIPTIAAGANRVCTATGTIGSP